MIEIIGYLCTLIILRNPAIQYKIKLMWKLEIFVFVKVQKDA